MCPGNHGDGFGINKKKVNEKKIVYGPVKRTSALFLPDLNLQGSKPRGSPGGYKKTTPYTGTGKEQRPRAHLGEMHIHGMILAGFKEDRHGILWTLHLAMQ